jgi:hypothetical protein
MHLSNTDDSIDAFTLELLRAGYALTGLAGDLAEAMPDDAYPGESSGEVVLQMISGTIRTFLAEADEHDVSRATELVDGAVKRVIEQLQLAVALRRRMDGEGQGGRLYDEPPSDDESAAEAPPEAVVPVAAPAARPVASGVLDELAGELLECGAVLSQLIAGMVEYSETNETPPGTAPIPEIAHGLVRGVLGGIRKRHSKRDVAVAAKIVGEATEAICNDIFFVDPGLLN